MLNLKWIEETCNTYLIYNEKSSFSFPIFIFSSISSYFDSLRVLKLSISFVLIFLYFCSLFSLMSNIPLTFPNAACCCTGR